MGGIEGIRNGAQVGAATGLPSRVLLLASFDVDEAMYDALLTGSGSVVLNGTAGRQHLSALRVVEAPDPCPAPVPGHDLSILTARETEVLELVARGLTNCEIAAELFVSENTVKTHVVHVLQKLGARDRVQAVVMAYESGLVTPTRR